MANDGCHFHRLVALFGLAAGKIVDFGQGRHCHQVYRPLAKLGRFSPKNP